MKKKEEKNVFTSGAQAKRQSKLAIKAYVKLIKRLSSLDGSPLTDEKQTNCHSQGEGAQVKALCFSCSSYSFIYFFSFSSAKQLLLPIRVAGVVCI